MDTQSWMQLVYLVLLGVAVGGWLVASNRGRLGRLAQMVVVWGLIFLGVVAGYGLWNDVKAQLLLQQTIFAGEGRVEIPRAPNGHYYVMAEINGEPVRFVVDTGATDLVLSMRDAKRAGIDLENLRFTGRAATANGQVNTARVQIDTIAVGDIVDRGVTARITEGELFTSLMGMDYLDRFDRLEIASNRMILIR